MKKRLVAILSACILANTALAQEDAPCTGNYAKIICGTTPNCVQMPTSGDWTIDLGGCAAKVEIYVAATTNIPRIVLSNGPTSTANPIKVSLGGSFVSSDTPPAALAGLNWGGLSRGSVQAPVYLYGGITGNLTGGIDVSEVYYFEIDGAINASFTINGIVANDNLATVYAGSIGSSGEIRNTCSGKLKNVQIAGDVEGGIFNVYGDIGDVLSAAISSPTSRLAAL